MVLYCLPYAGGSANIYFEWKNKLNSVVTVKPFEYKGHGNRYCEDFYHSIQEASNDICSAIINDNSKNFSIYGHSLGSIIAYETVCTLYHKGFRMPDKLILAGMKPIHLLNKEKKISHLPFDEFMNEIYNMGATSDEIIEDEELKHFYYDILKADMEIYENYIHNDNVPKLDIDVDIYSGLYDKDISVADLEEWQRYFSRPIQLSIFKSGHFFAFEENMDIFSHLYLSLPTYRKIS